MILVYASIARLFRSFLHQRCMLACAFTLALLSALLAVPSAHVGAASFACERATSSIEKMICADPELSALDEKLADEYQRALNATYQQPPLRHRQRTWLTTVRNACENRECLVVAYEARLAQLRRWIENLNEGAPWSPPPAMGESEIIAHYLTERREALRAALKGVPVRPGHNWNNDFCNGFGEAFARQTQDVELIPPMAVTHDYKDVKRYIGERCSDKRSAPFFGPRNYVLYAVDIDGDQKKEWLYVEEAIRRVEPQWGPEMLLRTEIKHIDLETCEVVGSTATGMSRRYALDADLSAVDPETGLYGVAKYQGQYYIYDVVEAPKAPPLIISHYDPKKRNGFSFVCAFLRH